MSDLKKSKRTSAKGSTATFSVHRNEQEVEAGTQFVETGQAEKMAWKITFHLPSEALEHERKFPKEEVRNCPCRPLQTV